MTAKASLDQSPIRQMIHTMRWMADGPGHKARAACAS